MGVTALRLSRRSSRSTSSASRRRRHSVKLEWMRGMVRSFGSRSPGLRPTSAHGARKLERLRPGGEDAPAASPLTPWRTGSGPRRVPQRRRRIQSNGEHDRTAESVVIGRGLDRRSPRNPQRCRFKPHRDVSGLARSFAFLICQSEMGRQEGSANLHQLSTRARTDRGRARDKTRRTQTTAQATEGQVRLDRAGATIRARTAWLPSLPTTHSASWAGFQSRLPVFCGVSSWTAHFAGKHGFPNVCPFGDRQEFRDPRCRRGRTSQPRQPATPSFTVARCLADPLPGQEIIDRSSTRTNLPAHRNLQENNGLSRKDLRQVSSPFRSQCVLVFFKLRHPY